MKYDIRLIGFINVFERITNCRIKDAFFDKDKVLVFIVKQGDVGKAIGKKGVNVKKIGNAMKKRIKIIEFNSDVTKFIRNCLFPLKPDVSLDDSKAIIKCSDRQEKAHVFGRDKQNLNALKELVGKFFKEVSIIVE